MFRDKNPSVSMHAKEDFKRRNAFGNSIEVVSPAKFGLRICDMELAIYDSLVKKLKGKMGKYRK